MSNNSAEVTPGRAADDIHSRLNTLLLQLSIEKRLATEAKLDLMRKLLPAMLAISGAVGSLELMIKTAQSPETAAVSLVTYLERMEVADYQLKEANEILLGIMTILSGNDLEQNESVTV